MQSRASKNVSFALKHWCFFRNKYEWRILDASNYFTSIFLLLREPVCEGVSGVASRKFAGVEVRCHDISHKIVACSFFLRSLSNISSLILSLFCCSWDYCTFEVFLVGLKQLAVQRQGLEQTMVRRMTVHVPVLVHHLWLRPLDLPVSTAWSYLYSVCQCITHFQYHILLCRHR